MADPSTDRRTSPLSGERRGERQSVELTPKQQTIELIKQAKTILVATHKNPDGDAIGSLLALGGALKKIGKTVSLVCPDDINTALRFLPELSDIKKNLAGGRELVISIDTAKSSYGELKLGYKHDKEHQKLSIVVSPSQGTIAKENVEISSNLPHFDLIIVLDVADIERLGTLYDDLPQIFFETPVINIDHHPSNDYFGKVNWIDLTATSTCEILVSLLESLSAQNNNLKLLTEDVATQLLTGIITDTGSFQNSSTTPKSFTVAAQLVGAGGRQQEIIKHIFKTKPLTTLHLWGKVLTNVTEEADPAFVWSVVSLDDLASAGASHSELTGVIDELLKSTPDVDFALLLSERKNPSNNSSVLHGSLRAIAPSVDVSALAATFGGGGHAQAAAFEQPRTGKLNEQCQIIIDHLKNHTLAQNKTTTPLELPA